MKLFRNTLVLIFVFFIHHLVVEATPSPMFWTFCTTDVRPAGVCFFNVNNFFTVFNRRGQGSSFPVDVGFEFGLFDWKGMKAEAGVDYLGGQDDPLFFNAKVGMDEDRLFCHSPSWSFGIFDVGTRTHRHQTNYNILNLVLGKELPTSIGGGNIFVSGYSGGKAMGKNRQGFMVAYSLPLKLATYCNGEEYYKWIFLADYASGKNIIGGGGFGVLYFFTPDINITTGPTWFNSAKINGKWKWFIGLTFALPVFKTTR